MWWDEDKTVVETSGNPATTSSNYDSLPVYAWDSEFNTYEYASIIEASHEDLSREIILPILCNRMGIGSDIHGYDYLYGPWVE